MDTRVRTHATIDAMDSREGPEWSAEYGMTRVIGFRVYTCYLVSGNTADRAARIKPIYSCAFTCTWSCMRTNFFYNSPGLLYLNPGALLHRPLFRITRTRKPWESALQVTAVLERIANAFSTFLSRMVPLITRTFLYPRLSALFYSEHNFDFCSGSRRRRPSALATGTFPLNFFRKGKKLFIMEGIITFLLKLIPLTSRASYTRLLKLF